MFQLRNVALALYAISSILASSLAIHAHVNRYLRKRRYHDTNFSELDEIEQARQQKQNPPDLQTYHQWINDYEKHECEQRTPYKFRRTRTDPSRRPPL